MRSISTSALLLLAATSACASVADDPPTSTTPVPACTATSSSGSGAFFDLRPDTAVRAEKGKTAKSGIFKDYHARGYDYGKNFTINICGGVVDSVKDVVGVKDNLWANVSAYYTYHDSVYSIG